MIDFSKHSEHFERMMSAKNLSENTKRSRCDVSIFFGYFKDKPSIKHINSDEVLDWLLTYPSYNTRKSKHCAVKWFYQWVINQPHKFDFIPYGKKEQRLPIIIDNSDVQKLINVCENFKHKTIILTLYATGVRISELLNIRLHDIDGKRGVIRVIGKGDKERQVTMNEKLYEVLKKYWLQYKTKNWLFENDLTHEQYSSKSVQEFLKKYKSLAGITSPVTPHKFRHSAATMLLEQGTDLRIIQKLLGHRSSKVTEIYTHVSKQIISKINSPINQIQL